MRILINGLGRDIHPTGICRVAANHIRALLTLRPGDHVVLTIGSWQQELFRLLLEDQAGRAEFVVVDIPNSSLGRNRWFAASLPAVARRFAVDIVHHSFPAPVIRSLFPCPVVVTLHDLYPYDIPENFGFPNYYGNRLILRQALRNADGVACVSQATASRLRELFPKISGSKPVVVTGNYVRISGAAPCAPAAPELHSAPFLLTVAQHRRNKNLDLLLRGYRQLLDRGENSQRLVIVGSKGPETAALQALVSDLHLQQRVTFLYSITDGELTWLYQHCSLVVLCSSIEGYCLPAAEALANHARIVCSDIAILREIGGDQGVYFSLQGDAIRNLACAISTALGQAPHATSLDARFADTQVLAGYSDLYARVLAQQQVASRV